MTEQKISSKELKMLTDLANQVGAEGIWLIRGAKDARLVYTPEGETIQPEIPLIRTNLSLSLNIADTGIIVLMRLPSDDGEPGIESR